MRHLGSRVLRGGSRVSRAALACVVLCGVAACGNAATESQTTGDRTGSGGAKQSPTSPFVYQGPTEAHGHQCTPAQVAARVPPIVYRPSWLSAAQKVPLVIGLHGAFGNPQSMQGISHFEEMASRIGFVVAYPGSCDDAHPWGPPQDFTYLQSLIPQLIASQNIDPSRVYVMGYSAGGYETWLLGCRMSRTVAAIAIVSGAMNGRLYGSCSPAKPVSQLLMVGTADGTRWTGIPGRLPSPFQTTARWRTLNGCAHSPVTSTALLPVVSQQTWSVCADGSAVSLVLVQGAKHGWPPYAIGAPPDYRASLTVWAFLSAHTAAPLSLTTSDAKVLSLQGSSSSRLTKFRASLHVAEPLTIVATLGSSRTTIYLTRAGSRNVTVGFSFPVGPGAHRVALTFTDRYGRTRRVSRTVAS